MSVTEILSSIEASQQIEKNLLLKLNQLTSTSTPVMDGTGGITDTITQIRNTSAARIVLFKTISDKSDVLQAGVANSRTDLVSQMTLLGVVEDQLNQAKTQINTLQNHNDTQMRLVEVNTYYGKRYEAQSKLMKMIILICVPLLILFILKKKGLIPELISNYAIGITIAVGAIFIIREVWNIFTRSNMNFDEFDWKYEDPTNQVPSIWQYNKEHMFDFDNPIKALVGNLGLCVADECCSPGQFYNKDKRKCMIPETFTTGNKLQGTAIIAGGIIDPPMDGNVVPFSGVSDYASL